MREQELYDSQVYQYNTRRVKYIFSLYQFVFVYSTNFRPF